jgi:hypothetical protein
LISETKTERQQHALYLPCQRIPQQGISIDISPPAFVVVDFLCTTQHLYIWTGRATMQPPSESRKEALSSSAKAPSSRTRFVGIEHDISEEASSHSTSLTGTTPTRAYPHPQIQNFQRPQLRHGLSSPRPPSPYPLPQGPPSEANDTPLSSTRPSPEPSPPLSLRTPDASDFLDTRICDHPDADDNISTVSTTSSENSNPDMNAGRCWNCKSSLVRTGLGPSKVTCVECWQEQPQ